MPATLTLPTIFTAIDRFTGPLFKMQTGLSSFAHKGELANLKLQRSLQNVSSTAKNIAQSSAIAGLALAAPLVYAVKEAASFEKMMAKVNTLNGLSGKEMIAMNHQVLDVTKQVPVTLEDVTHGLYIINSAGIMGAKGIDMVTNASKLAVAGLGTVPQAADMMSSVFNVFNSEGLKASEIANKLALVVKLGKTHIDQMSEGFGSASVIVQNAGIKLDEFLASVSALTVMGSTASEAYTEISGATVALLKPTSTMQKVFHQLGAKDGKTLIKTMGGLVPAMQAINKEVDKLHLSGAKAWGRKQGFMADLALTGNAHGHFVDNLSAMKDQPTALDQMFTTMLDTTDAKWQLLKNNLRIFAIDIGTQLLPVLTKLMTDITPIIGGITDWIERNPGWTRAIVGATAGMAGLLLVISPLAMTVGLAADGMRLYTMWSSKAALATSEIIAPLEAEELALSGITSDFVAADAAATGFFATLTDFVIPGALAAMAGWSLWEAFKEYQADQHHYGDGSNKTPFLNDGVGNKKEEDAYEQWSKSIVNSKYIPGVDYSDNAMAARFAKLYAANPDATSYPVPGLGDTTTRNGTSMPVLHKSITPENNSAAKDSTVHIFLYDPAGNVKDVKHSGSGTIDVKVSSTTGQR